MELGATMELRVGRGSQLEEEDTPYIVERQIQPLSTYSAHDLWYYRPRPAVLLQGHAVLPLAAKRYYWKVMRYNRTGLWYYRNTSNSKGRPIAQVLRAVLPRARYYCSPLRYYRKAGIP